MGGCERSGTSLVQKILLSHGRVAGGPEFVFTGRVAELYRWMSGSYPESYSSRIEAFYDRQELASAFRDFYSGFFARLLARKPDALYISEKTPSNIFAAPELLRIFPDSLFVHVIRDGRDVLASHRDVRRRFEGASTERYNRASFKPWRVCARWNRAIDKHFELAEDEALEGRVFTLGYEDLVRDPEPRLRGLFGFLGLEPEARAMTPETITAEETGVPIDGFWMTEEIYGRGFDTGRIGRWRRSLPLVSRLLSGLLMARNLRRAGYRTGAFQVSAARALHSSARALGARRLAGAL